MSFEAWALALDKAQEVADLANIAAAPPGAVWCGVGREAGTGLEIRLSGATPKAVRDAAAGRAYPVEIISIWSVKE